MSELIRRIRAEGLTNPFTEYHNKNLLDKITEQLEKPSEQINDMCETITKSSINYLSGSISREDYIKSIKESEYDNKNINRIISDYSKVILDLREEFSPEDLKKLIEKSKMLRDPMIS